MYVCAQYTYKRTTPHQGTGKHFHCIISPPGRKSVCEQPLSKMRGVKWAQQRQQCDTLHSITMLSCLYLCNRWHLFPALPCSSTHSPFARSLRRVDLGGFEVLKKKTRMREKKICTVFRLRFRKLAL